MLVICSPFSNVHQLYFNRAFRTRRNARRALAARKASVTHVAFAHHAALRVVLRHAIGAVPRTVLASNACIRTVAHDAGDAVLRVGVHWAASHACRFQALIASHRYVVSPRIRIRASFNLPHSSPQDVGGIAILFVASHYTAFAPDALRHVEVKTVLLAGTGHAQPVIGRRPTAVRSSAGSFGWLWWEKWVCRFLQTFDQGKFHGGSIGTHAPRLRRVHSEQTGET